MKSKFLLSVLCVGSILFASAQTTINVPEDYETIQEAINAASDGDTVQVSPGTYVENIDFMEKAITVSSLYDPDDNPDSSFIFNTIIDGSQPFDPDKGSVVTITNVGDTTAVLSGFTIKHGSGTYKNNWRHGGGIYCLLGAKIIHNIIDSNYVDQDMAAFGGGIYAAGSGSLPYFVLKNNIIKNNNVHNTELLWGAYGGGVACKTLTCLIKNNTIARNETSGNPFGCGVFLWLCNGIIEKNFIHNNAGIVDVSGVICLGGGIYVWDYHNGLEIKNNEILSNSIDNGTTMGGGIGSFTSGFCKYNKILIDGNVIRYNAVDRGGGIHLETTLMATVSNNVIQENTAYSRGGGIILMDQYGDKGNAPNALTNDNINILRRSGSAMPLLVNNTITNNNAGNGGGIANYMGNDAGFVAFNNIIYGNTAYNEIYLSESSPGYLFNNLLYTDSIAGDGTWEGADNIMGDPCLHDDLIHLLSSSCCRDMGLMTLTLDDTSYTSPEYDIDGDIRPYHNLFDLGADEWDSINPGIEAFSKETIEINIYPNPCYNTVKVEYMLRETERLGIGLFDISGRKVREVDSRICLPGEQLLNLNMEGLPAGLYYFRIQAGEMVGGGKMVKME